VRIAAALYGEQDTDIRLRDGDVLSIGELAGWKDIGATITVNGEVTHPGAYGIRDGERLSSILERAGGLRPSAYPYGAIFERLQVQEIEERNHSDLVRRVEIQGDELKSAPTNDEDQKLAKQAAIAQWQNTIEKLHNTPPSGCLVIHISPDLKRWTHTLTDLEVRAGDVLYIPKKPNIVMVDGSVYNPTAVTYKPGKNVGWYLRQAGGPTVVANRKAIFVIRADGSVASGPGGLFGGGVEGESVRPGDLVVVPEKGFSANTRWKSTLQAAQLVYAVGVALQVGRSF
jgi:protein involved in polysaccharide export with SLBB domain